MTLDIKILLAFMKFSSCRQVLKDLTDLANTAPVVIGQIGGEVRVYSDLDLALFLQTGKFPLGKWG